MKFDEDLWASREHAFLVEFIHQLAYFRKLSSAYDRLAVPSEYCTHTINAHLLRSTMLWCMVFGTDDNEIHWKKVLIGDGERKGFRERLRDNVSLDDVSWPKYWNSMVLFRNNYVAHVKAGGVHPPVPDMDLARAVVEQYDDHVRILTGATFDEPEIRIRYERLIQINDHGFEEIVRLGPSLDLLG